MRALLLCLLPIAFGQWNADPSSKWNQPNPSPVNDPDTNPWNTPVRVPAPAVNNPTVPLHHRTPTHRGVHEVQPSPAPGPFIHKDYHPPPVVPEPKQPIGNVEQRLRRIEVMLGLIEPECRNPITSPTREFRRMTYPSDQEKVFHSSRPEQQDVARRAGYTQEEVIGRVATQASDPNCECLIPLYRRTINKHVFGAEYRTKNTYPTRKTFLTSKDFPPFDYQGDLKNWAVEGYCVPQRGACGATLQLSRMTPVKTVGDNKPLILVTRDEDRVKWGYEQGWDEETLCYIWQQ
jgi:hypothetical protein